MRKFFSSLHFCFVLLQNIHRNIDDLITIRETHMFTQLSTVCILHTSNLHIDGWVCMRACRMECRNEYRLNGRHLYVNNETNSVSLSFNEDCFSFASIWINTTGFVTQYQHIAAQFNHLIAWKCFSTGEIDKCTKRKNWITKFRPLQFRAKISFLSLVWFFSRG